MRVVFIGSVEFSFHMLRTLLEQAADIVGVVTSEDRGVNSDYSNLEPLCKSYALPLLVLSDINSSESIDWIRARSPDVIYCFGWSKLIKSELLHLTSKGVIGYHPAGLPKNRGRHPLIWALVLGLTETASTFFLMDEGADSGDILAQIPVEIKDDDDAGSLYARLIGVAKIQLIHLHKQLKNGTCKCSQQDHSKANVWRKRNMKDGEIDWRMTAESIYNLVRGLSHPYVGAHLIYGGQEYRVWRIRRVNCDDSENVEPGKVVSISESGVPTVKCGRGCVELLEVEPALSIDKGIYL